MAPIPNTLTDARPTILIVDDTQEIAFILLRVLRVAYPAYSIATMTNAHDALLFVDRAAVVLVVTDFSMQGMNGLELAAALHARDATLPIVMMTAYGTRDLEARARAAGVVLFVSKPFHFEVLLAQLAPLLPPEAT